MMQNKNLMDPNPTLKKRSMTWIFTFGVWMMVALFLTSQSSLQSQLSENPVPLWRIFSWQLVSCMVWFLLTPLVFKLGRDFPLDKGKWPKSVPVHIVAGVMLALFELAIDAFILPKIGYSRRFTGLPYTQIYYRFVIFNLHLSFTIYWIVLIISQATQYYKKYRARELQASQLEARLAQARLQVLKMQLHPHFLFNTLNAISELIYRDPESAEKMITDLSELLRLSFNNLETQEVPLRQELGFLQKYLEIEQMRFNDRLTVQMDIDDTAYDAAVPNMILQPLVENAIKHGLGPRSQGGRIDINAVRSNGSLELSVSDDGLGVASEDIADLTLGVGLSNTQLRLKHLYGDKHKFEMLAAKPSGLRINMTIPFRNI
jgi:sensor histidine kinase YesM